MKIQDIPSPEKLPWSSHQWKEYLVSWTDKNIAISQQLYNTCPALFVNNDGSIRINKKLNKAHEILDYASAMMLRYMIHSLCEKQNIHPVALKFSHDLLDSSHRPPYIATDTNPLQINVLLDLPSYEQKQYAAFGNTLQMVAEAVLKTRISDPRISIKLDDIQDYPNGYRADNVLFSNPNGFEQGYKSAKSIDDNPQLIHAWRSKQPSKYLVSAAAAGGLAQKGELYLRWLDSREQPDIVKPLNEEVIEQSWPGGLRFFQMWSTLGIRDREGLKQVLRQTQEGEAVKLELPDNFNNGF